MKCSSISFLFSAMCSICLWEFSSADFSFETNMPSGQVSTSVRGPFVPGTKWCGPGTAAEHYYDFGKYSETDKCCRAHDSCAYSIASGETKYSLTNHQSFTVSECSCDDAFLQCLNNLDRSLESATSRNVKYLFFDVFRGHCFNLQDGVATWR